MAKDKHWLDKVVEDMNGSESESKDSSNKIYPPYNMVDPRIAEACTTWLKLLGYNLDTEHTRMTPYRLSWYVMNVLGFDREDVHITTFENVERVEDTIVIPNIPIWSACSHHLLPFTGRADFGYVPGERILGLSKIPLIIQQIAKGPWMQEDLTQHLANRLYSTAGVLGVIVRTECTHTCMMLDMDTGRVPSMTVCALRGIFAYNPAAKEEFMQHLHLT